MIGFLSQTHIEPCDQTMFNCPSNNRISFRVALVIFLKIAVGSGALRLGYSFRCGAILGAVINTFIAIFSYAASYLFVKCANLTKKPTYEGICEVAIGNRSAVFVGIISCLACLFILMFYVQFLTNSLQNLIHYFITSPVVNLVDGYFLMVIVFICYFLPLSIIKKLKIFAVFNVIGLICVALLILYIAYWFGHFTIIYGFDRNNHLRLAVYDGSKIGSCFGSLMTAYSVYPLSYPGLNHIENLTPRTAYKLFFYCTFACWIIYLIFGELSYLTLFDINEGDLFLSYMPQNWLTVVANVILFIDILFTCPNMFNASRNIIIGMISTKKTPSNFAWIASGILINLSAIVIAMLGETPGLILSIIGDALSPIMIFVVPSILYLFLFSPKTSSVFTYVLAIVVLIIGWVCTVYMIYSYF